MDRLARCAADERDGDSAEGAAHVNAPTLPATVDRTRFIGGSDAAAILGLSPWRTSLDLYYQKIGQGEPDDPAKAAIFRRGQRWEPIAREMLIDALRDEGHDVEILKVSTPEAPNRYIDPEYDFFAAEIDVELLLDGEHVNAELKTVHPFKAHEWGEHGEERVPPHYEAQAMWGLGVTGRRRCIVGALFGADAMLPLVVERDDGDIALIRAKAAKFWRDNVLARVPPEPSNMADIMRLFAKTNGRPVEITPEITLALSNLAKIRANMNAMEGEKEELEFEVCRYVYEQWGIPDLMTPTQQVDDAVLTVDGKPFATWKKQSRSSLDTRRLKEEQPDIAAGYSRTTWFRSIRFPSQKKDKRA